ncbi:MAG: hypothetical protein QM804_06875 [Propionicimonas sp.]
MEFAKMAVNEDFSLPYMGQYVIDALESLSDAEVQSRWGICEEGSGRYEDLDTSIHILYDDCEVLPNPERGIPSMLYGSEVAPLRALNEVFEPLIDELGGAPDEAYIKDPRWVDVMAAARVACELMRAHDAESKKRVTGERASRAEES